MALPTSGAISFAQLQGEFGGSNPITMGEYAAYRVAGSGSTISMSQFYGASAYSFVIGEGTQGNTYGYYRSSYGSMNPNTFRGANVNQVATSLVNIKGSISYFLIIRMSGNRVANWFNSITLAGVTHNYSTFSRSYSGDTIWTKTITAGQMMNGSGSTSGNWTI